jgi:hypothetical protein
MNLTEWSLSSLDYGRKLVNSGLEGVREGEEEFLHGDRLAPFLNHSARNACKPAFVGACLGVVGGYFEHGRRSPWKAVGLGIIGGLIGFGAGLAWQSRDLGRCIFCDAVKSINKTRDDHWFEKNPIDYA